LNPARCAIGDAEGSHAFGQRSACLNAARHRKNCVPANRRMPVWLLQYILRSTLPNRHDLGTLDLIHE
jgi:hypothetical protein